MCLPPHQPAPSLPPLQNRGWLPENIAAPCESLSGVRLWGGISECELFPLAGAVGWSQDFSPVMLLPVPPELRMRLGFAIHFAIESSSGLKVGEEVLWGGYFLLSWQVQSGRAACFPGEPPVDAHMFLQHLITDCMLAGRTALSMLCHKISSRKLLGHTNMGSWKLMLHVCLVGFTLEELSHLSALH